MKKFIEKTEKEIEICEVKVNQLLPYCWMCHKCHIVFLDEDIILKDSRGEFICPLIINEKRCKHILSWSEKKWFDDHYKIIA